MHLSKLAVVVFLVLCLSGCATAIKYNYDSSLYKRNVPFNYCVLVDNFEDVRPTSEHDGTVYSEKKYLCTADKSFKPNVNMQISQVIVEHLNKAKLFNSVTNKDVNNNLDQMSEEMESLCNQGINLVITGNIKHFYGYQSGEAGASVAFGMLGVLMEAVANPKTVGANVEYGEVKIIDIKNKKVLWEGDVKYDFEEEDTFYDGPIAYSLRGLKSANEKLVLTLESVLK